MQSEDQALRRKAERIVAAAGLARTVQHDINNLLTVIFANLEMLKRTAAEGAPQRQLGRVEEAARRFEGTSRAILAFIRRPAGEVAPIRLSEVLAALQPLLHMILSASGALSVTLADGDPPVLLERTALEEALLALAAQIAETQQRGLALALAVTVGADTGCLTVVVPEGTATPALDAVAAVFRAAGGEVVADATSLRLTLPRHVAPG